MNVYDGVATMPLETSKKVFTLNWVPSVVDLPDHSARTSMHVTSIVVNRTTRRHGIRAPDVQIFTAAVGGPIEPITIGDMCIIQNGGD
ncbi:hypothetical protein ABIC01_009204 [Bradyrhizobium sp. RT4b]